MRDYQKAWVSDDGKQYRTDFYERQGMDQFDDNPTFIKLIKQLERFEPSSILEIGCGFGRLLGPVTRHFSEIVVVGGDVSLEMLALCQEELNTVYLDICLFKPMAQFDVAYCRGVAMYFSNEQMTCAMANICQSVKTKMLVYEWPEVCERMKAIDSSPLFEYHSILNKSE